MTLEEYLGTVHRLTGASGVESFWAHSALLCGEVFCVVTFMAWAFSRVSRYAESIRSRGVRAAIACALLAVYCLVVFTSMFLFFKHAQLWSHFNEAPVRGYAYLGAALAFFLVGWSPMFYLYWRKQRLNPNVA